jgi:hypothetical protein
MLPETLRAKPLTGVSNDFIKRWSHSMLLKLRGATTAL